MKRNLIFSKGLLLLVLILTFPAAFLKAQNFSGRLILGINGSQIDGDGMSGYYKPGLVAGLGVRFPINEKIRIGPEFMYSMKGSKASFDQVTIQGFLPITYRLNYIDLPIVLDYQISGDIQAESGLSYGRLLNAKLDNGTNQTKNNFLDVSSLFNKSDFQFLIGLKYKIFDNIWLSGRFLYSVVSTNAQGLTNPNYGMIGLPSRGGFFNNLLQITLSAHLFGSTGEASRTEVNPASGLKP